MSPVVHYKFYYFHSTVQTAENSGKSFIFAVCHLMQKPYHVVRYRTLFSEVKQCKNLKANPSLCPLS